MAGNAALQAAERLRATIAGVVSENLGTLPDVAGSLAVVAARQGTGINMKVRALNDGVNSLTMQLDQALKRAHEMPPEKNKDEKKKS